MDDPSAAARLLATAPPLPPQQQLRWEAHQAAVQVRRVGEHGTASADTQLLLVQLQLVQLQLVGDQQSYVALRLHTYLLLLDSNLPALPALPAAGATATPGGGEGGEGPPPAPVTAGAAAASDPPINFEAAGSRVFVVRRKLLKVRALQQHLADALLSLSVKWLLAQPMSGCALQRRVRTGQEQLSSDGCHSSTAFGSPSSILPTLLSPLFGTT